MNTHGITYYVIRSFVRFLFVAALMAGIVIGIPMAVHYVWPALALSAVLWLIVATMYYRERARNLVSDAS